MRAGHVLAVQAALADHVARLAWSREQLNRYRDQRLRAFLTYANWSDGLRGYVGGVPYLKRTNGLTYGVQAETWW